MIVLPKTADNCEIRHVNLNCYDSMLKFNLSPILDLMCKRKEGLV
jgi:hypothetical protein